MPPKRKAEEDAEDLERKRAVTEAIKERIQILDEDAAIRYLDTICVRWQLESPPSSFDHLMALAFHNMGGDVLADIDREQTGSYGMRALDDTIHEHELEAMALYHKLRELELLGDEDTHRRIHKCLECIYYAKRIVLSTVQAKIALVEDDLDLDADLDARLGSWSLRFRWMSDDVNEVQKLLLHLLDAAMEKKYRKYGDLIFEPIEVDGYCTHAWNRVGEIKDFVYSECQKELQFEAWSNLTAKNTNAKAVITYLEQCDDIQFPRLKKDRGVWAFRNGVYRARTDTFHRFGVDPPLSKDIVACKYFDMEFETYEGDWREIPTPAVQGILDYQGFSREVCTWFYILAGRMLYTLGDRDGWQTIPFLKGQAGSGKSSITNNVIGKLYDATDVGILSNNTEKQFGIGALYDKYIFIAPEIKNDLKLEQAEFQSMVSGEDIQVAIKHKTAFSTKWTVPGFLAGNETPSWTDNSGSVQRRVIVFSFENQVKGGDMKLGEKLESQMGAFLVKVNRAYREATDTWGSKNIWEILPPYFKTTRNEMAAAVNSVEAFLGSGEVVLDPGAYCPFEDFKFALKAFESQNGYKGAKYTADFFRGGFSKFDISRVHDTREYRGQLMRREYLVGVDLGAHEQQNHLG